MRNCLTDEGRAEFQEWLDEGIAHLIKNEPELEQVYRCQFWWAVYQLILDKIREFNNIKETLDPPTIKELSEDRVFCFTTVEEYYDILCELHQSLRKQLINRIEGLSYVDKSSMIDAIQNKNFEVFRSIIQNNKECSRSFEINSSLAKKVFCTIYKDIDSQLDVDVHEKLATETKFGEYVRKKFPIAFGFNFDNAYSDEEWKQMTAYIKWDLGVHRYLHEEYFLKIDDIIIEKQPIRWQLPLIKGRELVHNMDKRLFNIFKHIPIPEDAVLVTALTNTSEHLDAEYNDILKYTDWLYQEKEGKANLIALKIKSHFKNVFLDEEREEFDNKTRYEMFVSLLDDFVNGKPKPKDYQILARTIYNSMYFIRHDEEDKNLHWKSWYKEFCSASGCVYRPCYETQNYEINDRVKCFESILPLDPRIKHDKKRTN